MWVLALAAPLHKIGNDTEISMAPAHKDDMPIYETVHIFMSYLWLIHVDVRQGQHNT